MGAGVPMSRAAFEKWARATNYDMTLHARRPEEYADELTEGAWRGWQAAQAAGAARFGGDYGEQPTPKEIYEGTSRINADPLVHRIVNWMIAAVRHEAAGAGRDYEAAIVEMDRQLDLMYAAINANDHEFKFDARAIVDAALGPAREEPRVRPCGCVVCTCATEDRCLGCGAKMCDEHKAAREVPRGR